MPLFSRHPSFYIGIIVALVITLTVPALLIYSALSDGTIDRYQKLSSIEGNITGIDNGDFFGPNPADIGDLDDDGISDLIIGSLSDDDGGTNFGAMYIFFMNADGTVRAQQKISATAGGFTGPIDGADEFGSSSAIGLGDLDDDGVEDIAIGERSNDDGGLNRGAVYILFLNPNGTVKAEQKISATAGGFTGDLSDGDGFGDCLIQMDDVNNDGVQDLAVCAKNDDDGGVDRGALWVLYLNTNGTVNGYHKISDTAGGFNGELEDVDRFAAEATRVSDIDRDGITDLAVGSPLDDDGGATSAANRGAVWILFMNANGTVKDEAKISALSQNFTSALDDLDSFGAGLADLGDLDGNGVPELAVSAFQDDDGGSNQGAVYILFLNSGGGVIRYQKISETSGSGFTAQLDDNDNFGSGMTATDDLDGDGLPELLISAHQDDDGGLNRGAVYILFLNLQAVTSAQDAPIFPFNIAFTINDGAACTPTRLVELTLEARDTLDIAVSNNPLFVDSFWQPFVEPSPMTMPWTLPAGDGEHSVFIIFRSATNNVSNVYEEIITLDEENGCGLPAAPSEETEPVYGPSPITGLPEVINPVSSGDYIRSYSYPTVYYVNEELERMPFYDEPSFCTWQDTFDAVKWVTDATLSTLPVAGPVFTKPGVVLVKIDSAPQIYAVIGQDRYPRAVVLREIVSEDIARQLYGVRWADYVIDVPVTLFHHFTFGSPVRTLYDLEVDTSVLKTRESLCQNL